MKGTISKIRQVNVNTFKRDSLIFILFNLKALLAKKVVINQESDYLKKISFKFISI